jgi:hypothetical protein
MACAEPLSAAVSGSATPCLALSVLTLRGPTDSSPSLRPTGAPRLSRSRSECQPDHSNEQLFDHGDDAPSGSNYL